MSDYIHLKDSEVGHPWNVAEILEDVVVYRFTSSADGCSSNTGATIKWLHGIKEEHFLSMSKKEIDSFSKLYGKHLSAIHIKYGEVTGCVGWDVVFRPEDVIEVVKV